MKKETRLKQQDSQTIISSEYTNLDDLEMNNLWYACMYVCMYVC